MIEGKRKPGNVTPSAQIEELRENLRKLKPQTKFGETLLELSRENLASGAALLDADQIMSELGRSRCE